MSEKVESRNVIDNDTLCLPFNLSCIIDLLVVDAERGDDWTMNAAAPWLRFLLLKASTWHFCFSMMNTRNDASTRCVVVVVRLLLPILLDVAILNARLSCFIY